MSDWRRPESAPKDGTKIIGRDANGRVSVVEWADYLGGYDDETGEPLGAWRVSDDSEGWLGSAGFRLRWWMPIPAPPKEDA